MDFNPGKPHCGARAVLTGSDRLRSAVECLKGIAVCHQTSAQPGTEVVRGFLREISDGRYRFVIRGDGGHIA
ncbi:conserved hypothetical protein [Ricinus communis]|uniref:Uncharacterized protein n=1 Tax=Ricinus communis TaxID=3988 RepID=B9T9U2_RICCO|nr:conserved hypothetical protein [Ricinus communis]